jgi:hypothetical protein
VVAHSIYIVHRNVNPSECRMVFDGLRQSFDELLRRATRPEERRVVAARMRDTLVQARVGLAELRGGLEKTRARLDLEAKELETVRRRKQLAEGIGDKETVDIAGKYEEMHQQRVEVVRQKVAAQEAEITLAERDVREMTAELKSVMSGADRVGGGAGPAVDPETEASSDPSSAALHEEMDALSRARAQADREADATRRLDELKRRMRK